MQVAFKGFARLVGEHGTNIINLGELILTASPAAEQQTILFHIFLAKNNPRYRMMWWLSGFIFPSSRVSKSELV